MTLKLSGRWLSLVLPALAVAVWAVAPSAARADGEPGKGGFGAAMKKAGKEHHHHHHVGEALGKVAKKEKGKAEKNDNKGVGGKMVHKHHRHHKHNLAQLIKELEQDIAKLEKGKKGKGKGKGGAAVAAGQPKHKHRHHRHGPGGLLGEIQRLEQEIQQLLADKGIGNAVGKNKPKNAPAQQVAKGGQNNNNNAQDKKEPPKHHHHKMGMVGFMPGRKK